MSDRRAPASQGKPQADTADVIVAKKIPWMGISVALHVIALSILVAFFVPRDEPQPERFVMNQRPAHDVSPVLEPIPDVLEPRTTIPDFDAPPVVNEEQESVLLPSEEAVDEGREDLDNPTTDPDAIEAGPDSGFTGGTSIGVGINGHVGRGVSPHAGPLGNGGGKGKGKYDGRRGSKGGHKPPPVVAEALDWLGRHQDENGSWSPTGYTAHCEGIHCEGTGEDAHTIGVTGLALLAFLGAGNTMSDGDYRDVVSAGVQYLLAAQNKETGAFGEPGSSQAWIYDQALASLAICEAYGLSRNSVGLKRPAQKAVYFCQSARNPYKAWRYAVPPNGDNDVSVTGWMVMVLRSAKDFGLIVDDQAFDGSKLFLDEMTDPNVGRTGYNQKGTFGAREPGVAERWPNEKVEPMTAVAMMCRIFMGEDQTTSPTLRQGADLLRKSLPAWDEAAGTIDYYYWYYGSYAMFQMGGQDWAAWQAKMQDAVASHQIKKGCEDGSWDPRVDPWGHRGGRVYSTAILALCSEVQTRYGVIGKRGAKGGAETPTDKK